MINDSQLTDISPERLPATFEYECKLTVNQKRVRLENSHSYFERFKQNANYLLQNFETDSETSIHHYIPGTKK